MLYHWSITKKIRGGSLYTPPTLTKDSSLAKECLEVELEKEGVSSTIPSLATRER